MSFNLKNKKVLVCGSTYGIGYDIAIKFLEEGAKVIFTGRTEKRINFINSKIKNGIAIKCDFANKNDVISLRKQIIKKFKSIDTLICNIGFGKSKSNLDEDLEDWYNIFNINLMYSVSTIKILSNIINKKNKPTIIFISSICGLEATPAPLSYSSAKAALNIFSKNLSNIYIKKKIRVNCVSPGNVLFKGSTWEEKLKKNKKNILKMINEKVPLQRFANPREISNVVAFLASDYSSFIVGQNIIVDGGQSVSL